MDGCGRTAGKVGGVDRAQLLQARDRVLDKWKTAKRAESKERIAQALDLFIAELTTPVLPVKEQEARQQPETWEETATNFLEGVQWNERDK